MRLWKKASGALKDQTSLWQANLTRRTALRNPDIEKAVIQATSHHESSFDRRNVDRVCEWIRLSPYNLKPILWSVSNRMEKTRNWVVALKGLYLMHVVMNSRMICVKKIGRLPFDLSNFKDGHSRQAKAWPFNAFVRAYYAFLDQKSTIVFQHAEDKHEGFVMMHELVLLQKLQGLVDLLMQIKPVSRAVFVPLIIHVMDGIIIEIYDIYSRICRGIAIVLMNIYSAKKAEATMALNIVQKATQQGEDLMYYFEFCQEIGVVNASEFPVIDRIPDEGIYELEQIIRGFSPDGSSVEESKQDYNDKAIVVRDVDNNSNSFHQQEYNEKLAIVVVDNMNNNEGKNFYRDHEFRTIITDNWERFDEDFDAHNPFGEPSMNYVHGNKNQEPPDLIAF